MNEDLVDEIEDMIDLLAKSGFFSSDEILEILEDQFIEEEIDFSGFDISHNNFSDVNFNKLDEVFKGLTGQNIVCVHNCGYDIEEGVSDVFELFVHLKNNGFEPIGFCFYTFEDVEEAINDETLKITFGDFENSESKALNIGKTVANALKQEFDISWNVSINQQIKITPFKWDKSFRDDADFEIEGAYNVFTGEVE